MSTLFLIAIALLLFGAMAALLARAVALPRLRIAAQVRQIGTYGLPIEAPQTAPRSRTSPLHALAAQVGRWSTVHLGSLTPLRRSELLAAGIYELSVETVHGWRVLAAGGLPALTFALTLAAGSASLLRIVLVCALAVLIWRLTAIAIQRRGQKRLDQVDRALPDLIDVLTATIEAGLGFAGSLSLCAKRFDGPLGQELRLTLQEQTMGLSTEAALANMRERCDTPSVRAFVRAVSQGESLGVSIGAMMRNLATDTRKRRRARAQQRMQQAPVKMLFPLVFLIFPSLLVVLLYPGLREIFTNLGGG